MKKLKEALGEAEEKATSLEAERDHALKLHQSFKEVGYFYSSSVNLKYS